MLFKAKHLDTDAIRECQEAAGKKRGPYPLKTSLPIDSRATESLGLALESIKSDKKSKYMTMPVLFVLGVKNYDKFDGELLNNKERDVTLKEGADVYVMDVKKVKVEEDTMLENYMETGEELTIVYLFNE